MCFIWVLLCYFIQNHPVNTYVCLVTSDKQLNKLRLLSVKWKNIWRLNVLKLIYESPLSCPRCMFFVLHHISSKVLLRSKSYQEVILHTNLQQTHILSQWFVQFPALQWDLFMCSRSCHFQTGIREPRTFLGSYCDSINID